MPEKEREKLLESLKDATGRLQEAEAAKKRDATLHRENIAGIKGEIHDIMQQLEQK